MPFRPEYHICPGDRLEVEVVQPDGGRALVVGKLDVVPKVAGGCAMRIVVCDAPIKCYPRGRPSSRTARLDNLLAHQQRFRLLTGTPSTRDLHRYSTHQL